MLQANCHCGRPTCCSQVEDRTQCDNRNSCCYNKCTDLTVDVYERFKETVVIYARIILVNEISLYKGVGEVIENSTKAWRWWGTQSAGTQFYWVRKIPQAYL